MLKEAGAAEVHVRVSSPPFLWPCYFGTDVPAREQLIAYERTVEEVREMIGADSLGYLKLERLEEMADRVERDYRRRGRVYEALGLSGGAFLVILLL